MGQKRHIRGFRAALAAAGSTVHPSLVPGTGLWFWAMAAAMLFGSSACATMGCSHDRRRYPERRPAHADAATTLDDESRQAAIVEWTHRMADELVASRLFAGLLPQMMRAGVDAGFQAAAAEAVVDELRHARLCAAVVETLGGEVHPPVLGFEDVPRHEDVGALEALLRNVLSICCLEETAAVALLENDHRLARESTLRRVIAEILDDEIRHSRLGWRMLQSLAPRIDGPMRKRLGAYLVPAFARLFDRHLTSGEAPGAQTVSAKVLFVEVVNEVIVPRLEAFDLPAGRPSRPPWRCPTRPTTTWVWAATD